MNKNKLKFLVLFITGLIASAFAADDNVIDSIVPKHILSTDFYAVLEIEPQTISTVTDEQIKKKYRQLALKYHPDKLLSIMKHYQLNPNMKSVLEHRLTEAFKNLGNAYERLSTRDGRANYSPPGANESPHTRSTTQTRSSPHTRPSHHTSSQAESEANPFEDEWKEKEDPWAREYTERLLAMTEELRKAAFMSFENLEDVIYYIKTLVRENSDRSMLSIAALIQELIALAPATQNKNVSKILEQVFNQHVAETGLVRNHHAGVAIGIVKLLSLQQDREGYDALMKISVRLKTRSIQIQEFEQIATLAQKTAENLAQRHPSVKREYDCVLAMMRTVVSNVKKVVIGSP